MAKGDSRPACGVKKHYSTLFRFFDKSAFRKKGSGDGRFKKERKKRGRFYIKDGIERGE